MNYDNIFRQEVEDKVNNLAENQHLQNRENLDFNIDFQESELDRAIYRLKFRKTPGPDSLYPEILYHAGEYFRKSILHIFNLSWCTGRLLDTWRHAAVKFLRKHNKTDFYSPSSYRPISLTSVLCKLMERIVLKRLGSHVESNQLLDTQQEGFRRYHSTTYAVTRLVQSIANGFNKNNAFHSVWRPGLIYKLSKIGESGRL